MPKAKKSKKRANKKTLKKQKITKDMTISSVIQKYPQTSNVFISNGMYCFGCSLASDETVEQGAKAHPNINLKKLISELNKTSDKRLDEVEEKISNAEKSKPEIQEPKRRSFLKRLLRR